MYKSPCYCTNLRRSANRATELYDRALAPSGLSVPQYYLLINLSRMGKANAARWAEQVGLERTTLVRNVRLLEQRGLVTQTEGRGRTFTLTEMGRKTLAQAVICWEKAQREMAELLGEEDAQAALRICEKLQGRED